MNPFKCYVPLFFLSFGLFQNLVTNAQQEIKVRSAEESDPVKLGWIKGSPPAPEHILHFDNGSFFQFPGLRWSVSYMRQFMPTVNVSRGLGNSKALGSKLNKEIDDVRFKPLGMDQYMSWKESLQKVYADGAIILHHGQIVYEQYFGSLQQDG